MTNDSHRTTGDSGHPADRVYPERYYEILARDLGDEKARWARLPYAERMRELAWYHANFNTPDDLSPWPAELAERLLGTGRHCAAHLPQPGDSGDHATLLYDERGLPR